ncbi:MAG: adenylyltransferase/cytidyltransferase family protein, partial [Bacteroidales bacterium]|nr:adenylyltransferase/cytidyltransferase family protein [Bacteroidales bacterium]
MSKLYHRAITYGTFDLFHIGHLKLLNRIASLADEVIVAVSSDEFNALKNKKCTIPFEQRSEIVAALRVVTKVIKEDNWEQK